MNMANRAGKKTKSAVEAYGQRMRESGLPVPSVGRVVHYFAYGTPHGEYPADVRRAAIITEVDTPGDPFSSVGLCVLNPSGIFFNTHVAWRGNLNPPQSGTWGWTEYIAPIQPHTEEHTKQLARIMPVPLFPELGPDGYANRELEPDGMGEGDGVDDGGSGHNQAEDRKMLQNMGKPVALVLGEEPVKETPGHAQAYLAAAQAATPQGSVLVDPDGRPQSVGSAGDPQLDLRVRIMVLENAMREIYNLRPLQAYVQEPNEDTPGWVGLYDSYVGQVRSIARKALEEKT